MTPTPSEPETYPDIEPAQNPWSAKATAGFGLLTLIVFFAVQVGSVIVISTTFDFFDPQTDSGLTLAVAATSSGILCSAFVLLLLYLRNTPSIKQHLALTPVTVKTMIGWIVLAGLLVMIGDQVTTSLGRPVVPDVIVEAYRTAYIIPLFWFAVVIGAPLFEEIFFRGFLFEGFSRSRLGVPGTVLLTTLIWTIIHIQYDAYELSLVFALGIFLAIARVRTRSLYVPFTLHAIMNLIATIQTMMVVDAS